MQRNHWSTQRTERHRSRIRQKRQTRSLKRNKAKPHQDRAANRHWSSKARGAFKESSEDKSDQQQLKAAVLSDADQAFLQKAKPAGANRELVHKNDGKNDPEDGEQTVAGAENRRENGQMRRHVEDAHGDDQRNGQRNQRGDMSFEPQNDHSGEENHQGKRGPEGRQPPVMRWIVRLHPGGHPRRALERDDPGWDKVFKQVDRHAGGTDRFVLIWNARPLSTGPMRM